MRVVFLTHYADRYGANRSLLDLVTRLKAAEQVEPLVVLAREGPLEEDLLKEDIAFVVEPFPVWMAPRVSMGGPHHRLKQWLARRRGIAARARAAKEVLPRLVAHARTHRAQWIHSNSAVIGLGGALAKAAGARHAWHVRELPGLHYGLYPDGGDGAWRSALRQADAVIAVSGAVRDELLRIGGEDLPVEVMPNPVADAARLAQLVAGAEARWKAMGAFRFAMVGLFHKAKGQLDAVEAFAQVLREAPDAVLELAGDGAVEPVRQRIAELGIADHVLLPGFVSDPFAVFGRAHCALMTSRHEAYGRATAEAMASGIPVIGHASGATPELIQEGATGHLYATVEELTSHMLARLRDPQGTIAMGRAALRLAATRGTVEDLANRVARLYSSPPR
ncbi:MAG: glycosyltransferase [Flavobacteriales bacterium]|nr:glycosyltransferase [Flavobacteriales bacterium]